MVTYPSFVSALPQSFTVHAEVTAHGSPQAYPILKNPSRTAINLLVDKYFSEGRTDSTDTSTTEFSIWKAIIDSSGDLYVWPFTARPIFHDSVADQLGLYHTDYLCLSATSTEIVVGAGRHFRLLPSEEGAERLNNLLDTLPSRFPGMRIIDRYARAQVRESLVA